MNVTFFGIISIIVSILAFLFAAWLYRWVRKQPSSNKRIAEVGNLIRNGADTFLNKEYRVLARFAGVAAILIFIFLPSPVWMDNVSKNITMAIAYIAGTIFSAVAGKIGMNIATIANTKAAEAAVKGIKPSFMAGFRGGAVMGR